MVRIASNQTGGVEQIPCLYIVVLLVVLLLVYAAILVYQWMRRKKEVRRHKCDYCGRLVVAVSKCHYVPVMEKLGSVKCSKCGHESVPVCSICKKPMDLKGEKSRGLVHEED